jgi:Xaa-Pro aminopeptidase
VPLAADVSANRIDRLRQRLGANEIDGLLVTDEKNVRYLTGFTGDSTSLLVTGDEVLIISDRRYEQQLEQECPGIPAAIRGPDRRPIEWIAAGIRRLGPGRLGVEADILSWSVVTQLMAALPEVNLTATGGLVAELRAIKEPREIETIRRAIHCAERAFGVVRASLRAGITEIEIAHLMETSIRQFGGEGVGFPSIVAVGPAGALPHYQPGKTPVADGQGLLIDWGAKVDGYTSDMTRTLSVGRISEKMREIYPIVLDAHLAAIDRLRPGAKLADIDAAARKTIEKAGYGEAFGHGLGHGIGLNVHESPRLASTEQATVREGMVVTIEPGIYLPGELGVRIEDDLLVTPGGCEVLGSLAKGLDENQVIL